jgi:5-formaminoimidazole-4-carboxamide-1-(beta)-D-ribofuranosyl 5'-monophosphate synthetase
MTQKTSLPTIATLGSHSALQIAKGAHDEGLKNLIITTSSKASLYKRYSFIDEIIEVESFAAFSQLEAELTNRNLVVIPHGSFVAYLGLEKNRKMKLPYFGNKYVLDWEFNRDKQMEWMEAAEIRVPQKFAPGQKIDRPVIIKSFGAAGGVGYALIKNQTDLEAYLKTTDKTEYLLQEYIIGVPVYVHFFQSVVDGRLEILSVDRRYETNADGLGRLPIQHQTGTLEPSFTVVGNSPLVIRESLLSEIYDMAERVIAASKTLISPQGLFGPFCLEMIIDENQKMYVIEISARIVAGSNLFIQGSPYSDLFFDEPMSTGRRIAREVKTASTQGTLDSILHKDM